MLRKLWYLLLVLLVCVGCANDSDSFDENSSSAGGKTNPLDADFSSKDEVIAYVNENCAALQFCYDSDAGETYVTVGGEIGF